MRHFPFFNLQRSAIFLFGQSSIAWGSELPNSVFALVFRKHHKMARVGDLENVEFRSALVYPFATDVGGRQLVLGNGRLASV